MEPVRYTLDNGLRVVIEENHTSPVVALEAWVDVGSASEPPDLAGIAHVFEHMLFKGTERRAVGEIARDVESVGGDINAWTSFDETVYHLVLPSRHFGEGLDILSDALQHSTFDPTELERELKVVLEELKQGEDSPARVSSQSLFATAYQRHPYRRPVIGGVRTVRAMTRAKLLDFFRKNYVARNVTLVICGDLDPQRAKKEVERLFGKMPGGEKRRAEATVEPVQKAPRVKIVNTDVRESHVQLGFHIPSVRDEDAAALEVLALVLGHGESSRLETRLRREREVVNEAFAYAYAPRDPGLFVVGATTRPADAEVAADALFREVQELTREPVADEELARAKTTLAADGIYQKETMQGRARKIGYFEAIGTGAAGEAIYLQKVASLRPADLIEVAKHYFTLANLTVSVLGPAAAAPKEESLLARLDKATRVPVAAAARTDKPKNGIYESRLPSGARLFVLPDAGSGLVAMRAVFLGGQRYEDSRKAGISNLIASLITRGTRTLSGDEIAREVDGMAGALGGFSGRNTVGIAGEFLAAEAERGLALLADCALHPSFAEVELERERRRVLEQIRTEGDHPSAVAFRVFHEALFPTHPYRQPILGDARSVAMLTRRALTDWHARYLQPSQMVLTVVGDVDVERIRALAEELFPASAARAAEAPKPTPDPVVETGPRESFQVLDKRQAHVVYGFPGTTLSSPDRFALEILASVLGGQSGRLFMEVRDKRGLAYRVSASSVDGIDPGYFAIYLATSPENLGVAVAAVEDEIEKLRGKPIDASELDRAKRYLIGAHDISLQRRSALASSLAFNAVYGLGSDAHLHYAEDIEKVGPKELMRVAARYLDRRRAVVATVHPDEHTRALSKHDRVTTPPEVVARPKTVATTKSKPKAAAKGKH